jgi:hypothetical protein
MRWKPSPTAEAPCTLNPIPCTLHAMHELTEILDATKAWTLVIYSAQVCGPVEICAPEKGKREMGCRGL